MSLNAEQQSQLREWFSEGATYKVISARVLKQFGITVGRSALCDYWQRYLSQPEPAADAPRAPQPVVDLKFSVGEITVRIEVAAPAGATIQLQGDKS